MRLYSNPITILASLWVAMLSILPAFAHEVKVSGDVAATFHINPSHHPKVGVPSTTWFALTRRGGKTIPLSQCNCQLAIYPVPHQEGKTPPLMKPALSAMNIERYQNLPGATIVFPKSGVYELELTGTAKSGANFKPFQFSYQVTVTK